jgi:hypothetical protein
MTTSFWHFFRHKWETRTLKTETRETGRTAYAVRYDEFFVGVEFCVFCGKERTISKRKQPYLGRNWKAI